jgi:hypothetical protein
MKRYREGIAGDSFFQKQAPKGIARAEKTREASAEVQLRSRARHRSERPIAASGGPNTEAS